MYSMGNAEMGGELICMVNFVNGETRPTERVYEW